MNRSQIEFYEMASAPQDGTHVMLFAEGRIHFSGWWNVDRKQWEVLAGGQGDLRDDPIEPERWAPDAAPLLEGREAVPGDRSAMSSRGYSIVALYRPAYPDNVGGVMRLCYAFDVAALVMNPSPMSIEKIPADTVRAWRHLPVHLDDPEHWALPYGSTGVAVEIAEGAEDLSGLTHPERAVYFFGPENGSLPPSIMDRCDQKVRIATRVCLNLATAVAVTLYDRGSKRSSWGQAR